MQDAGSIAGSSASVKARIWTYSSPTARGGAAAIGGKMTPQTRTGAAVPVLHNSRKREDGIPCAGEMGWPESGPEPP
jgi:hypothetical protein